MKKIKIAFTGVFDIDNFGDHLFPIIFENSLRKRKIDVEKEISRLELEKNKKLDSFGSIGTFDIKISQENFNKQKAESDIASINVERCDIKAPFDGRIASKKVSKHQSIKPQDELLEIVGLDNLEARVVVPSSWLVWLKKGIEFDLGSDRILPSNRPILTQAINYINASGVDFKVIGGTDTRGTNRYNQKLSERRAQNVKNYLIENGADRKKLEAIGTGEKNLLYPECDPAEKCEEWKNRANRRVYFEVK